MSEIDALWEYGNPAESERRFRAALDASTTSAAPRDEARRLELLTQLARSLGMQRRFDEGHAHLDEVERALGGGAAALGQAKPAAGDGVEIRATSATTALRPRLRLLLERGRLFNSAGERDRARVSFEQAWREATVDQPAGAPPVTPSASGDAPGGSADAGRTGIEGLAVDAAHMVAITLAGSGESFPWTERGIDLARRSSDPKARALLPALLNNMAWDLHDLGRFAEALPIFEQAQQAWSERSRPPQIRIARWSVAHCLRSLGRNSEALAILRAIESELASEGARDAKVDEEIAANLAMLAEPPKAE